MLSCLHHVWAWLRDWSPYILPAVSNLILVLLGVIMSLPKLAEAIEDTPKYRKLLATTCLVFGLVGFTFDVGQRRSSDRTNKQLLENVGSALGKTDDLVDKTTGLVSKTNRVVATLGLLQPKIVNLYDRLSTIDARISLAKNENNQALVAVLQTERKSFLTSLLSVGPGIVGEMQYWAQRWYQDDNSLYYQKQQSYSSVPLDIDPKERSRIVQPFIDRQNNLRAMYPKQLQPLVTSANYLRKELLRGSEQTPQDKKIASTFAKALAGEPYDYLEMKQMANYMDNLVNKAVPTPQVR